MRRPRLRPRAASPQPDRRCEAAARPDAIATAIYEAAHIETNEAQDQAIREGRRGGFRYDGVFRAALIRRIARKLTQREA